jgi:hypothetical protein
LAGEARSGLKGTLGGFQTDYVPPLFPAAFNDGFIARFDPALANADSTTPTAFSFPTQTGVASNSTVTSAAIRIYGYTAPIPLTVSGGMYSLDGGSFTSSDGVLQPGQLVRLRHTSAVLSGQTTETRLSAGGVTGTFDSISQSGSTVAPHAFAFQTEVPVARDKVVVSNPIIVTGTNAPAPVSIVGGQYSIDGGDLTSAPGTVNSGQAVVVSHTSAGGYSSQTDTTLSVGGITGTFSSVTDPLHTTPHAFAFAPPLSAQPATLTTSYPAVITGINGPASISVSGGAYSINGQAFGTAAGTVNPFDDVIVQLTSGAAGSTTSAIVSVNGVSAPFTVTLPGTLDPAAVPLPFTIPPVTGAQPNQWVESVPVILSGFTHPAPVQFNQPSSTSESIVGQWYDPQLHEFIRDYRALALGQPPNFATLPPGQPLRVRLMATGLATTSIVEISVGGVTAQFSVTTVGGSNSVSPTAFNFADQLGVNAGSTITSETLTLAGLSEAAAVSTAGCQVSITGQPYVNSGAASNGDTLTLQIVAPSASGTSATCSITVGAYTDVVKISTSGTAPTSGTSKGGGGTTSLDILLWLTAILALRYFRSRTPRADFGRPYLPSAAHAI